ncbi:MAG TPA: MASE1 domain-containing protein [Polyangiaceae bacterium]|nr:MASE1 domain-containing protein [Polyangiaceae bacterium]
MAEVSATGTFVLNPSRRGWELALASGLTCWLGAVFGSLLATSSVYVAFWLPSGIYLAALLITPRRNWPWVCGGAVLGNVAFDLAHGTPPLLIAAFCLNNTLQALLGAWLTQRFVSEQPRLRDLREFLGIAWIALASAAIGALSGAAIVSCAGTTVNFASTWRTWFASCAMADFVVVPFALSWLQPTDPRDVVPRRPGHSWETALLCLLLGLSTWYMLVLDRGIDAPYKSRLFPLLLWAALRLGTRVASALTLGFSLLMAFLTAYYKVGLTPEQIAGSTYILTLQTFAAVSACVAIIPAIAIDERERALVQLRDSEERFRQLTSAGFEAVCISERGRIVDGNDQALRMFRVERDEFIGKSLMEFIAPASRQLVASAVAESHEAAYEHELLRRDGTTFFAEAQARVVKMGRRTVRMTALRDVTERKQAEAELRAREEVLRQFIKHAPAAIAITDRNLCYLQASDRWLSDYHMEGQDIIGKCHHDVFPDIPERWKEIHQRVLQGSVEHCDEDAFPRADGALEWLQWEVRPWYGADGTVAGVIFFTQVITERKRAEAERIASEQQQRALEAQLRQAQKMEAIGTLAGGIAHDFNNILGAIIANAELMSLDHPQDAELQANVEEVLSASKRAARLVQQILTFSRRQPQERRSIRVEPIVREAAQLLRSTLPATIRLELNVEAQLPNILADATQLHQILINLGTNSGHAMRGKQGTLEVKASTFVNALPSSVPGLAPGNYVHLTVKDSGHGMSEEVAQRVFEPFFTTKSLGEGTGLGLAVVHGIVQEHGGAITLDTALGKGTTFHVYLPIASSGQEIEVARSAPTVMGRGQRILLVDDERAIAEGLSKLLERHGYRTLVFTSPSNALESLRTEPNCCDLVLTDLTMPQMTGTELARAIHALRPDLPVVLTTGSRADLSDEAAKAVGIAEILVKPLDYTALLPVLERLLASALPS